MATTSIGGINIGIGIDTTRAIQGLKAIKGDITKFQKQMTAIRLAGAIKGDPFKETRNYMNKAKTELNNIFKSWSKNIGYVNKDFNKFAENSRIATLKVVKAWEKVSKKFSILKKAGGGLTTQKAGIKNLGGDKLQERLASPEFREYLNQFKGLSKRADAEIKRLSELSRTGLLTTKKRVENGLLTIRNAIGTKSKGIIAEYERFGSNLKKTFAKLKGLDIGSRLKEAKSEEAALKRKKDTLTKLIIKEKQYRTEIKKGIDVGRNRTALAQNYIRRQEVGMRLTKKQTEVVRRYRAELNKVSQAQTQDSEMFSKKWFTERARWFIQLRAFWEIWRRAVEAFRGAFEFQQEMANVRAITQATDAQFEKLRKRALEVGSTTRFSAKEAAEGMVVMSQAGLDVEEVFTAIKDTAMLATATLHEFKDTAKLITIVMRAWNMDDVTKITDILATSINKTRLTMESLGIGFNYVSGIAPQLNLSLQDTTAILGTMVNNGLAASTASTSLRAMLSALLHPTKRFKDQIKLVGLALEDINPQFHSVENILVKLKESGFNAAEAFRGLRRRAASGISIAIRNADTLKDLSNNMYEFGRASQMADENLDTAQGQWKQFSDLTIKLASDLTTMADPAIRLFIEALKELSKVAATALIPITAITGTISEGWGYILKIITEGWDQVQFDIFLNGFREIQSQMKDSEKSASKVVEQYRKFRDAFTDFRRAIKQGKEKGGEIEIELFERALNIAEKVSLITDDELTKFIAAKNNLNERDKIEKLINKRYKIRKRQLASEYKVIKDIFEIKKETALMEGGVGVSEILYQWKEIIKQKKQFDITKKTKKDPETPMDYLGGLGDTTNKDIEDKATKVETRIRKMINNLSTFQQKAYADPKSGHYIEGFKEIVELVKIATKKGKSLLEVFREQSKVTKLTEKQLKEAVKTLEKAGGPKADINLEPKVKDLERKKYIKDRLKLERKINDILADRKGIDKEIISVERQITDEIKKHEDVTGATEELRKLELKYIEAIRQKYKNLNEEQTEELTFQLKVVETTSNFEKERLNIMHGTEAKLNKIVEDSVEEGRITKETYELMVKILALEDEALNKVKIREDNSKLQLETRRQLLKIEQQKAKIEDDPTKKLEMLQIEEKELNIKIKLRELTDKSNMSDAEKLQIIEEIAEFSADITKSMEAQRRAVDPIYDAYKRILSKMKSIKELWSDVLVSFYDQTAEGFSGIIFDASTGFQDQQQQAAELKQELKELGYEYQQALSEGNVEKTAELSNEMARLKKEIKEVEDPLRTLGKAFKDMAKSVIDNINKMIIKWLVWQAIQGITKAVAGSDSIISNMGSSPEYSEFSTRAAHGGVLPQMTSFRKFSRGGITGNPTLALLGDNPSKKELVIPSENIEKDKVSGYTREKEDQAINIINVVTQDDIAKAMAGTAGTRTIVNTIGRDLAKKGTTYRQMRA